MKGLLLDTHVVIWLLLTPERLRPSTLSLLRHSPLPTYASVACVWEIGIKRKLGRLEVPGDLAEVLDANRIEPLDITLRHAQAVESLPLYHGDPFDRIMVAQAKVEGLTLVTQDGLMRRYDVDRIDA